MMRIEIASNLQAASMYGDGRAAAAARASEEKQPASADARAAEARNDTLGLGPTTSDASVNQEAALIQSASPSDDGADARSSSTKEDLASKEDDLEEFISVLNELSQMSSNRNRIEFMFDSEEEMSVIRVVDRESGEMIRQIPPEKLLAAMDHIFSTLGIVLDQTA